jgi:hypothetical protein
MSIWADIWEDIWGDIWADAVVPPVEEEEPEVWWPVWMQIRDHHERARKRQDEERRARLKRRKLRQPKEPPFEPIITDPRIIRLAESVFEGKAPQDIAALSRIKAADDPRLAEIGAMIAAFRRAEALAEAEAVARADAEAIAALQALEDEAEAVLLLLAAA